MKTIKFIWFGLYKNKAIIDGRKNKWWLAVILFIISVGFTILPILINTTQINGSTFFNQVGNSALDVGLTKFSQDTAANCKIDDEAKMTCYDIPESNKVVGVDGNVVADVYRFGPYSMETTTKNPETGETITTKKQILSVYYMPTVNPLQTTEDKTRVEDFLNKEHFKKDVLGANTVVPISYMVISKSSLHVTLFPVVGANVTTVATKNFAGDFISLKGTDLSKFIVTDADISLVMDKWADLFDKSYENIKKTQILNTNLLYAGLNSAFILIAGVMLFIMSRGKTNPNNKITFLESMKMGAFMSLSPAILAMVAAFLMPQFASIAFVAAVGGRAMFMGTKMFGSTGTGSGTRAKAGPVYQARK